MAYNFIDLSNDTHGVAGSTRLSATTTGQVYDIIVAEDTDNGQIIGRGDYVAPTYYRKREAEAFTGLIIDIAPNGNYYVEVLDATNAYLVLTVPTLYEEKRKEFLDEKLFYNKAGDKVRAYRLYTGDVFEVSVDCFAAGHTPTKNATVDIDYTGKLTIA